MTALFVGLGLLGLAGLLARDVALDRRQATAHREAERRRMQAQAAERAELDAMLVRQLDALDRELDAALRNLVAAAQWADAQVVRNEQKKKLTIYADTPEQAWDALTRGPAR